MPTYYDGTQLVVSVRLPDHGVSIVDVYDYVYGMHLDDGAKPWPYYRDAHTGEWWSLSTRSDTAIDAIAWMIPLDQLHYRPRLLAEEYLNTVYLELETAAADFGGTAEPECDVKDALLKMDRVAKLKVVRDFEMTILVCAPEGQSYTVADWVRACKQTGLQYGDGNLFWLLNDLASEDNDEPFEYFSVEPYSEPGHFHHGDLNSSVTFPDVALSFRVRDFKDPFSVLEKMVAIAEALANHLGANVLTSNGSTFDLTAAKRRLHRELQQLRALDSAR